MSLTERQIELKLKELYEKHLVGANKLHQIAKSEGVKVTKKKVKEWFNSRPDFAKTIQPKPVKQFIRMQSPGPNWHHQADLAFFKPVINGYKGFLVVVDVYSRYMGIRPFKSKSMANIKTLYLDIMDDGILDSPRHLFTDHGGEFNEIARYFDQHLTEFTHQKQIVGRHQIPIVDRAIFGIKQKIVRKINLDKNSNWPVMLDQIAESHNNTVHSTINVKPIDAILFNEIPRPKQPKRKLEDDIPVGTKVRVKLLEQIGVNRNRVSDRQYWSDEKYTIRESLIVDGVRVFKLSLRGKNVEGLHYFRELQIVS